MTVNKAILIGNVGNDPEIKYVKEDVPVARFRLATSETYTKDGERITNTEWHNIVAWRGLAKVVESYVRKGTQLFIEGKITTRSYDKDGETKYFTEIVADNLRLLGKRPEDSSSQPSSDSSTRNSRPVQDAPVNGPAPDDDLPF
jgi:single-strand DNA-binding protein